MTPYYDDGQVVIYHGDCREVLPLEVDAVVTDPPYGTGGWRRGRSGAGSDPRGSLVIEEWDDGAVDWVTLAATDAVVTFWPSVHALRLLAAATADGLTYHQTLYMRKRDSMPKPQGRIRWSVEPVWVLSRKPFGLHGGDDVVTVSTPRLGRDHDATGHPYQKPVEALTWVLSKTSVTSLVDPFMGSGTTLVAAKALGLRAVGIEQDEGWCEVAARRLAQGVLAL